MHFFHTHSLRWRIYLAFLLAAAIPTGLAGTIGIHFSLQSLRTETANGLEREVVIRAQGITRFLEQVGSELQYLAESPTLRGFRVALRNGDAAAIHGSRQSLEDEYAALARLYPYVYQIRFLDAAGLERVRVDRIDARVRRIPVEALQDKSDRYYFTDVMQRPPGSVYLSPLDLNVEFGEPERPERPVIRVATPVGVTDGPAEGMLIINLHADIVLAQIQEMADARAGSAYLFDRAGHFVSHEARAADTAKHFEMRPIAALRAQFGDEALGRVLSGTAGVESSRGWTIARATIAPRGAEGDEAHWTVALAYPERHLFDAVFNLYALYAVLFASLVVTAIGGLVLSRRLLRPLELLSRETETIAGGDFSSRVRWSGTDEIATLGERFNSMAARLHALYGSIERQRDQLEVEVEARTQDLEQERAFLFALVQNLGEGVLVLDDSGLLRLANPRARALLGLPDELVGLRLDLLWPDWAGLAPRVLGGEAPEDVECDGRLVAVAASRFDGGVILLVRDVSHERRLADDRRELDRQMFQMERMVTFGELAMGLAHEIGNPLAGMKAVVQALQYEEDLPPGVLEALRRLEGEVDRLSAFLRSFHGFAAQPAPTLVDCRLEPVVEDVLYWLRKEATRTRVEIRAEGLAAAPPVRADQQLLKQVLLNLFINALHAMPEGGRLAIRAEAGPAGRCRVRVSDTGQGIAPELMSKIFNPFFTTRPEGTGLGLAIVRKIAVAHGAAIEVASRPGEGTEFMLDWPAAGNAPHE